MIGIFDSGSGGLTVLKELKDKAPEVDVVYFGDLKNVPYGEKTPEELGALTTVAIEKLLSEGAFNIISACNSVSASVAQPLIDILGRHKFGMIEMIGPTVKALSKVREKKEIEIVATPATVKSGIYQNAFSSAGVDVHTTSIIGLADAVEANLKTERVLEIINRGLGETSPTFDTLVLGCTQFPFAEQEFKKWLETNSSNATIFDPAKAVANEAVSRFGGGGNGEGRIKFILSKDSKVFRDRVSNWFGKFDYKIEIL